VRPFLACLDESLAKVPPPPPAEVAFVLDPSDPMSIEAEVASLVVSRVLPDGQAWRSGMRPGCTLVRVGGKSVATLEDAAAAWEESRQRGDSACEVVCLVETEAKWRVF